MPVETPAKPKSQKFVFEMPHVEVGDTVIVRYRPDDERSYPCLVMMAGRRTVDLLHLGAMRGMSGIRHRSDPDLRERPELLQDTGGCWEESTMAKRLKILESTLEELGKRLTAIEPPRP